MYLNSAHPVGEPVLRDVYLIDHSVHKGNDLLGVPAQLLVKLPRACQLICTKYVYMYIWMCECIHTRYHE